MDVRLSLSNKQARAMSSRVLPNVCEWAKAARRHHRLVAVCVLTDTSRKTCQPMVLTALERQPRLLC